MNQKKYFIRIDILRILSCLLVLLYHLNIVKSGFLAVCTFFTLSGYLATINTIKNQNFSIKKYYLNRIKTIYIPLLIVISITLITIKQTNYINWINLKQEATSAILGYNNFWQLNANLDYFTKNIDSPFIHLWYISILLQFDLIFPILILIIKKIDKKIKNSSTIIIFVLLITFTLNFYEMSKQKEIMTVYYSTFARIFSIFWGMFLALIHHKYNFKISKLFKNYNRLIYIIYLLLLTILCIFVPSNTENYALYMILITLISCRIIEYSIIKNDKKNNIINFFARSSYEIYLVHYPTIILIQNLNIKHNLKLPLIILITLIISTIIYLIINLKIKNKIIKLIRIIILTIIIILGIRIVINEKDHTKELKDLENKLNDNLKIIEEKNKQYINNSENEEKEWNEKISNLDADEEKTVTEELKKLSVVGIGDSVFLNGVEGLYEKFPNGYFDGKVSRSLYAGIDILKDLKNQGKLSNTVILALANNGDYMEWLNRNLMEIIENRTVYWINAVGADDPEFNTRFSEFAKNYPNIHIIDWVSASKGHPEYFYKDGIHTKDEGTKIYVKTIYDTIYNDYLAKYREKRQELINQKQEELKKKITFYGNDILINSFELIKDNFNSALFNAKSDYNYDTLYKEIKEKVDNNTLEYKIVFIFDKEFKITDEQYKELIDLCKNHEIYICNTEDKDLSFLNENVKIIDFYNEIKENEDYIMADKIHLSINGNKALANLINNSINQ